MAPLYLIVGGNKLIIEQTTNNLLKNETSNYDLISFDMDESSLAILLEEIQTIPFLYDKKIILLKNPLFLYNPDKYNKKLVDEFVNLISHPQDTTSLIIYADSLKSINKSILEILKSNAIVNELVNPTDESLNDYIIRKFNQDGYILDNQVVSELIERTKGNNDRIELEIDKLKTYKAQDKLVLNADVRLLVSKELDDNIFELVNSVIEKDTNKTMKIFDDMMTLNVTETVIISLLTAKFNELYETKVFTIAGMSKNDIADLYHVKPGRIYYAQKAANTIGLETLKKKINELIDLDYKIKSGEIDKRLGLELFLLNEGK